MVILKWLPYLITLILLVAVFLEYHLKHIATDRRTNKHRNVRRLLLGITILGIIAQQIVSATKERQREQRNTESSMKTRAEVSAIKTNQQELGKTLQNLVNAISTNSSIDAETRKAVLSADKKFEAINNDIGDIDAWEERFNKRKNLSQLQTSEAISRNFQRSSVVFDYVVRRLETMMADLGKKKNQPALSDYKAFPSHAPDDAVQIAEIKLGTNILWNFQVWTKSYTDVSHLSIGDGDRNGKTGWLLVAVRGNDVSTEVKIESIGFADGNRASIDDYKECIDKALQDLIAGISVAKKTNSMGSKDRL